jgi:hypothetical protein
MIESNEPKDGDFVTYVEKLVRLPEGMRLPSGGASPGEVGRGESVWSGILKPAAGGERARRKEREQAARHQTDAQKASKLAELAGSGAQAWGRSVAGMFGDKASTAQPSSGSGAGDGAFGQSTAQASASRAARRAAPLDAEAAARMIAKFVTRLGSFLVFVGIALIAMSFADRPPIEVDPAAGIVLTAVGAVIRRVAGRIA